MFIWKLAFLTCFFAGVFGHGTMVIPFNWFDTHKLGMAPGKMCGSGYDIDANKLCPGVKNCGVKFPPGISCMWYNNYTFIPGEQTLKNYFRTFEYSDPGVKIDFTKNHPWRAPGSAPIFSPCGVAGGNPYGCKGDCSFAYPHGPRAEKFKYLSRPVTQWKKGNTAEVAWGITANHGGGYAYRLCKIPEDGVQGITEECFQNNHLKFAGDKSWVQYGYSGKRIEFVANRTTEGTYPPGSQWTKNPIPACQLGFGGYMSKTAYCENVGGLTQFPPPAPGLFGFGTNIYDDLKPFQWSIVDQVIVPSTLQTGKYILSWRWDCEQTPQVWATCATIDIVE